LVKKIFLPFLFCFAGGAWASFAIEPAIAAIQVGAGENAAWLELAHTGGAPMAVEMAVYERELDLEGEVMRDTLVKSKDFMIYPSEIILYQGERVRVQVIYKGKQRVTADKAYILSSREVPLPVSEEGGGVRVGVSTLMNYLSVVSLETGKPGKLTFVSSKSLGGGEIEVIVENKSGGRVRLDGAAIIIGNGEKIANFTGKKNSVMPGQKRRFTFKYSRPLTAKEFGLGAP
jgi:P pilus assembly chaperone PapD